MAIAPKKPITIGKNALIYYWQRDGLLFMNIKGILSSTLPDQFPPQEGNGKTLILDADSLCYVAAAKVKKLDTAVRHWVTDVLTYQFLTGCEFVEAHLTASDCHKKGRKYFPTAKEYQSNRLNKQKPPLLEALRDGLPAAKGIPECIDIQLHHYHEADDHIVTNGIRLGDKGVIVSFDKDMRIAPSPYWDVYTQTLDILPKGDTYGWIKEGRTEAGAINIKGHGRAVLMLQWLAGDTADAVKGIERLDGKLCGIAKALEFLVECKSESEAANKVLWAYVRNKQNALSELEMLYLSSEHTAYDYLCTLDLEPKLRKWIDGLHEYNGKYTAARRARELAMAEGS